MITDIQLKWLEQILKGEITKSDNPRKYSAYMRRIQNRVDAMMVNLEWIVKFCPEIFKYEEREFDDPSMERHSRLKRLLRVCIAISPFTEDPTLFKILSQISPTYGVEFYKKPAVLPKPMVVFRCKRCKGTFEDVDMKDEGKCPHCGSNKLEDYE